MTATLNTFAKFEKLGKLGQGTYGTVYDCKNKATGQFVAIKKIRVDDGSIQNILREIVAYVYSRQSKHVGKLLEYELLNDRIYLVMQKYSLDLDVFCKDTKQFISIDQKIQLFKDVEAGIKEIHRHGFIHRDLKPKNIMVENGRAFIVDLGMAKLTNLKHTHEIVTITYRAPEIFCPENADGIKWSITEKLDLWSLGCIAYFIYYRKNLINETSEIDCVFAIYKIFGSDAFRQLFKCPEITIDIPKNPNKINIENKFFSKQIKKYLCLDPRQRGKFESPKKMWVPVSPVKQWEKINGTIHPDSNVTPKNRQVLVEWMLKVQKKFSLTPHTIMNAVALLDIYIEKYPLEKKDFQLLGVACMVISAEYYEIYCPEINDWTWITGHSISVEDIQEKSMDILKKFDCKILRTNFEFPQKRDIAVALCMDGFAKYTKQELKEKIAKISA